MKLIFFIAIILLGNSLATAQKKIVTIFLAGDSTCAIKTDDKRPETGWGEELIQFFRPGSVKIDNRAKNGRSTKTFINEGLWQQLIGSLDKGDYVFIQFGHNDESKDKGERYTPPDDFRANLVRFITEVKRKGGNPVLLTPIVRRRFDKEGKFFDTHGEYPEIVRQVARQYKTPLLDLHLASSNLIQELGVENSKSLFLILKPQESLNYPNGIEDNTHFSPKGAYLMAMLVAQEVRRARLPIARYLNTTKINTAKILKEK